MSRSIANLLGGITMMNIASLKSRLKRNAVSNNRTFNEILQMYFLERFLYRLSVSEYKDSFTIKGGILLYALFHENYARATSDIDLLGNRISNDEETIRKAVEHICEQNYDDLVVFNTDEMKIKKITEFKEYNGINVEIPARIDKIRGRVSIDIGFGDVVFPNKERINFPTLVSDDPLEIYAYSKETIIAEKFQAIVSLALLNSRLKDFYDIYAFSKEFNFNGSILKDALIETFEHRNTKFDDILAFEDDFITPYRKGQWTSFIKKKSPNTKIELIEVIVEIKRFILPIVQSIKENSNFDVNWDCEKGEWE